MFSRSVLFGVRRFVLDRVGNPVLEWELLQRRKSKTYVVSWRIVYGLYFLFVFTSGVFKSVILFATLFWFLGCMVFLVLPVFGATSVVSERRSRTLELVQLTSLRPFDIVWGKVVAPVAPILVFVFSLALPVALLSFFEGNVIYRILRESEHWLLFGGNAGFLVVPVLAMAVVFTVSALSVLVSTFSKSSAAAVAMSYGMTFMLLLYLITLFPKNYHADYDHSWSIVAMVVYCVFVAAVLSCAAGLFVWWACKRLRLPVVSISAKSSAAAIPMSRVAVPVSLFVTLILLLLSTPLFVLNTVLSASTGEVYL